ncbi:hypothetical protein BJF79_34295 [Actinomadura sp. CNU-125]|uniref:hypothetical protein n=1 Tax=Actinomadura sp. CNU-125 TaxID=1904961 RepID=UPI00095D729A|nr:hypothetical protein [Actinomadura sp. CNU-125]OLT33643.1 hypothetical protein BJF79_34295 [Actinomadura sp. CNU-125]
MSQTFSQELCSLEPFKDSLWWAIKRPRTVPCTVRIEDGELTITRESDEPVVQVPIRGLEIVTPRRVRKLEAGVVLQVGGEPVAVMFDQVHARQRLRDANQQGMGAVGGHLAKPVANTKGNMALAREITAEFLAALLAGGAVDTTTRT